MTMPIRLPEFGTLPAPLFRFRIRRLLARHLRTLETEARGNPVDAMKRFAETLRNTPLVPEAEAPDELPAVLPTEFFMRVLGGRMLYSCGYWSDGVETLDASEDAMLALCCERAEIEDGMRVLIPGCGWGPMALWIAQTYPTCSVVAATGSDAQREFIMGRCAERGLRNVEVQTADLGDLDIDAPFDRVIAIELLNDVSNIAAAFERISEWLKPEGKLFAQVFCHRRYPYRLVADKSGDWLGRMLPSGGMMPSAQLYELFQEHLRVETSWQVNGLHYSRTLLAWLQQQRSQRPEILPTMGKVYGRKEATRWFNRWRVFFLSCAEVFRYRKGEEWFVGQYRLVKK